KAAAEVAVVSLFFAGVNAFIAALVVVFFRDSIASLIGIPAIKPYLWLLPVGVLVIGMYQVFHYWMIRTNAFGSLSRSKLAQTVGQLGVQVGAHSVGPIALMLGHVVGQSMGATRLGVRAIVGRWDLFGEVRAHGMRE